MNREDINKLWAAAYVNGMLPFEQREKFARLIAAAEREACAKVCEAAAKALEINREDIEPMPRTVAIQCAAEIRARGES